MTAGCTPGLRSPHKNGLPLNLPFSEWTTMFPNARLCKAMVDRLTDQAHIIDTGKESYRLQRTLAKNEGGRR